jgi:hypothetical protein
LSSRSSQLRPARSSRPVHRDRMVDRRHQRDAEPPHAKHAVAKSLVVMHDVEVPGLARNARTARILNVSGSGNAPPIALPTLTL